MVQLKLLNGVRADSVHLVCRFPCLIGRAASADIRLEETGVWERHLELSLDSSEGFVLKCLPNAFASVNGQKLDQISLKSGDLIEIGGLKIRFWLSETHQRSLRLRESLTWAGLGILSAGQIGLIYWLLNSISTQGVQ